MNSDRVNSWVAILANVGILAGLVLVAIELNQNTEQLSLELMWQVNERMMENNRAHLGDNPTPIFVKSIVNPEELTYEEFHVAGAFVLNYLGVWEDRYFLYQAGLLSDEEWKHYIDDDISYTLGNRFAQELWRTHKKLFEPVLVQYVDELLPDVDTDATHQWWLDTREGLSTNPQE